MHPKLDPSLVLPPEVFAVVAVTSSHHDTPLHPGESNYVAGRRMQPGRVAEFRTGRACARAGLAHFGIVDYALIPAETREPQWPRGIVGSISHCGDVCLVAVAETTRWAGLGVDVEASRRMEAAMAATICTDDELRELERCLSGCSPGGLDLQRLGLIFSAKESIFKATFPQSRVFLDFRDVAIEADFARHEFSARATGSVGNASVGRIRGRFHLGEYVMTSALMPL